MESKVRVFCIHAKFFRGVPRTRDWHHLIGLKVFFSEEGVDTMSRNGFHPECTVQDVRLIGRNTAIVQVAVSYDEGIALEDGDRIPPFSEIYRLALVKVEDTWRISAQDMAQ